RGAARDDRGGREARLPPCARTSRLRRARLKTVRALVLHAGFPGNETFSYQVTWPRQFRSHRRFESTVVNLGNTAVARGAAEARVRHWRGDVVVLLHSVFSNAQLLDSRCLAAVQRLPQPKAFFIGNEYKLMPEKMRFCRELPVALLVSQSSSAPVHRLYRE